MKIRLLLVGAVAATALAGCASTSPGYGSGGYSSAPSSSRYCADCGIVTRIDRVASGRTAPSATGAVLGGIVGAVAGRELADDKSSGRRNTATAAGAVAGAVAGNAIQNRVTDDTYDVHVRMDDGRTIVINQRDLGGVRENTYVRVVNGRVVIR
ncbi:glycine zipper 2TM domain-containing protein [Pseudoxanthomonas mexicana]|uniref:glycine zipper 2TM domain-containing protein n=1 Tax=Pseudoxanthomonas mexicana TaxID=128785 RepID=UPI00398BB6BF